MATFMSNCMTLPKNHNLIKKMFMKAILSTWSLILSDKNWNQKFDIYLYDKRFYASECFELIKTFSNNFIFDSILIINNNNK